MVAKNKKKTSIPLSIKILLLNSALVDFAAELLGPVYAILVEDIGGSILDASASVAIFSFMAAITTILSGKLSDKYKHPVYLLTIGYTLMGIAYLFYLRADSVIDLFILQAIIGIGEALSAPAYDALYTSNLDHSEVATEWGLWEAEYYIVSTLGALTGGLLITFMGFKAVFWLMAGLTFLSAFIVWHYHILVEKRLNNS